MRGKIIISYPGSKSEIIEYIVNNIDYSKECFIDLFGGSGSVILNKKPHKVDIYNDINEDLYALFYSLHFHYDEFMEKVENLFACEKFFYTLRDMDTSKMSILEKGVRAFYLYSMSFMGFSYTFAYGYNRNLTKKFFSKKQLLKELKEKFKHITVLNKDYKEILELIKNKTNIMLYADPPYFGTEYVYKDITFTKEDHETLAKYLNDAKYSVMISYEYFDGIYDLYPKGKWKYIEIHKIRRKYNNKTGYSMKRKKELLIINYDVPQFSLIDGFERKT